MASEFTKRIYEVVRQIPRGCVASYGQVAFLAGNPRGARGVGFAMHRSPEPGGIPCHRVVFKDGGLCGGLAFGGEGTAGGRRRGFPAGRPRRHGPLRLAEIKFFRRSPSA